MHFNKFKAFTFSFLTVIAIYLGHVEYHDHPAEYFKSVLDLMNKALVLVRYIGPAEESEQETKRNQGKKNQKS